MPVPPAKPKIGDPDFDAVGYAIEKQSEILRKMPEGLKGITFDLIQGWKKDRGIED